MAGYNQPRSRKKNVVDSGKEIEKKGNGLGTGGVGMNAAGSQPRRSGEERAEKKDTYKPSAKPSAETVKRVGEAFQTGVKAIAKAAADPVGTIRKVAKSVGKAAGEFVETAKENGPKVTATADKKPKSNKGRGTPLPSVQSTLTIKSGKSGKTDKASNGFSSLDRLNSVMAGNKSGKQTLDVGQKKSGNNAGKVTATEQKKGDNGKKSGKTNKQKAQKNKQAKVVSNELKKPFNATEAMKARRAAAEAAGKGKFNATEEMKKRRAAAEAAGKGKFNATEEMKKRRAAAEAQGKGKWNAQEEMRKRREAAESRKRIQNAMNGKGK